MRLSCYLQCAGIKVAWQFRSQAQKEMNVLS